MAVAWIGNRETLLERAVRHAAALLHSSRCPVFSFDTDIDGTRAAITAWALLPTERFLEKRNSELALRLQ